MIHSTEVAQRRLLEAMADANNAPAQDIGTAASPLLALVAGVRWAAAFATDQDQPATARVYNAVADLAEAVDAQTRTSK